MKNLFLLFSFCLPLLGYAQIETPNVIIVVIDGARATEAFHDTTYANVPYMQQLFSKQGSIFGNFKNNGVTNTCPGHTAITTGVYQKLDNTGLELPDNPSIFQYYLKQTGAPREKTWIVTSKGKLEVLANTKDKDWKGQFKPKYSCGAGRGTYRDDKLTLQKAEEIITTHQPKLMLVQFKEPDISGHRNDWEDYIKGLQTSDSLTVALWNFVQQQPGYTDNTIMLVTNDHGRHTKHFAHHGDDCDGCRSIFLLAIGKGIPVQQVGDVYEQIDISATIAHWLHIDMPTTTGRLIEPLVR
jgi:bisphosphoglycerate-independent phosphoglycerate mutase (AlkP superfamily)